MYTRILRYTWLNRVLTGGDRVHGLNRIHNDVEGISKEYTSRHHGFNYTRVHKSYTGYIGILVVVWL